MLCNSLENSEVCSVIFIRDYLQFYFEGEQNNATLTFYSLPVTVIKGEYIQNGTIGYRDSLCSFIEHLVKGFIIEKGKRLKITFDNDDWLEVSLESDSLSCHEAAMLRVENQIAIW